MQGSPFEGLRVVELASGIAGPYAGKLLCDAGADVIKLEEPGGDPLRRMTACGAELAEGEDGALFRFLNASKRSVEGFDLALDLAARADLVIESFGPGGLEARGIGVEALQARNSALSVISVSPWGLTGPWADRPTNEFVQQAAAGSTARRQFPGRVPVAAGGQLGEYAAGAYASLGAVAAWLSARRTGAGQHVDVSIFEAVVTVLTTFFALRGTWIDGPMAPSAEAPSIEPAKDGWVGFCTYTGQQWVDFCALISRPDLAEDERFFHASERFKNRELILGAIHEWTLERSVAEILETATLLRIPSAPVHDARSALACDHFRERGVFVASPHGFLQPRVPYRLGSGETRAPGRAPSRDEHRAEIQAELAIAAPASAAASGESALPLEGLRVVDLTAFWAGPVVTSFLADMGADVVKIESTQRPDGIRFVGATGKQPMWEWSEVFHGVNPGKRSVTLNLDTEEGRGLLLRLVESADVMVENGSARVLENFGLGFDRLHELNPRLILLRMPAWGLDGPWRDRTGFAANVEQAAGIAWLTGYDDAPLVPLGSDPIGGTHAALALLAALEVRRRTGEGQLVETALVEPCLNIGAQQLLELQAYDVLLSRMENRSPFASPQGVYRCAEPREERESEFVAISAETDEQWHALCEALGHPDWNRDDPDDTDAVLSAWCADRHARDIENLLVAVGVPASMLVNPHFLIPNPQLEHREFFQMLEHPVTGETAYASLPMRFSAFGPGLHTTPPPTLGQHNRDVLKVELGLTEEELERLEEAKVIGTKPAFLG